MYLNTGTPETEFDQILKAVLSNKTTRGKFLVSSKIEQNLFARSAKLVFFSQFSSAKDEQKYWTIKLEEFCRYLWNHLINFLVKSTLKIDGKSAIY
jgi:hypothetical protein